MKKNELKPAYNMGYSRISQLGDKAISLLTRDATELFNYGVNDSMKNSIILKTQSLKDLPTDGELLAKVSIITQEKNTLADTIRTAIRNIAVRAKNLFGAGSPQYHHFGVKDLDRMPDDELYRCVKRVVRTATTYLPELTVKGLTEAEITALSDLGTNFDLKIDQKDEAVRERDIATEARVRLSNELYALITELFDYGKTYWYTREEAKYNDYIIYDQSSAPKKPALIVAAGTNLIVSDQALTGSTVFEIENTGSVALSFYVTDNSDAGLPDNALTLAAKALKIVTCESISNGTYGFLIAVNNTTSDGAVYAVLTE